MVVAVLLASLLGGQTPCLPDVSALGLADAAARRQAAAADGCEDAAVGGLYLTGLIAAEEAWRQGGTDASLTFVRSAAASLAVSATGSIPTEVARLVLLAAAAAAQSEHDELAVFLAQANHLEQLLQATGQPVVPYVSSFEAAGDLWMRVHRYAEAQRAYAAAAGQLGSTPRITASAARAAQRLRATAPVEVP
ncbi:MAG: hypothetical protein ABL993_05415 [Vicinamibacterales bacterium]